MREREKGWTLNKGLEKGRKDAHKELTSASKAKMQDLPWAPVSLSLPRRSSPQSCDDLQQDTHRFPHNPTHCFTAFLCSSFVTGVSPHPPSSLFLLSSLLHLTSRFPYVSRVLIFINLIFFILSLFLWGLQSLESPIFHLALSLLEDHLFPSQQGPSFLLTPVEDDVPGFLNAAVSHPATQARCLTGSAHPRKLRKIWCPISIR